MKSFIEYLTEAAKKKTAKKYHPFETVFGSHSKEKNEKYHPFETVFGSHSKEEKKHVKEVIDAEYINVLEEAKFPGDKAKEQIHIHSEKDQTEIHKNTILPTHGAISAYTHSSSNLNGHLHAKYRKSLGLKHNKNDLSKNQEQRKIELDKALDHVSFDKDTHVFTGLPHSPHHAFRHTGTKGVSVKVHLPAYTSTTTHFKIAQKFADKNDDKIDHSYHKPLNNDSKYKAQENEITAKHVLKLHIPKGAKAGSVKGQTFYSHEKEILLHRGHNIEIHHRPTVMKDGTHVWHARVISHTPHD